MSRIVPKFGAGKAADEEPPTGTVDWTVFQLGGFDRGYEEPAMQLKQTLGRIGLHLPRHSAKGVLIMDAPRTGNGESWKSSQARYSNAGYDDPWPSRA